MIHFFSMQTLHSGHLFYLDTCSLEIWWDMGFHTTRMLMTLSPPLLSSLFHPCFCTDLGISARQLIMDGSSLADTYFEQNWSAVHIRRRQDLVNSPDNSQIPSPVTACILGVAVDDNNSFSPCVATLTYSCWVESPAILEWRWRTHHFSKYLH